MSAEDLITSLEKLLKLHKSLYEIAVKKTDVIKKGDMDALNQILKEEQAHIAAIKKIEEDRQLLTKELIRDLQNPSVTDCIERTEGQEKANLISVSDQLTRMVFELKEQNYLNQQLINQSLHFVNVSLSLLRPQLESINYAPPKGAVKKQSFSEGLFNSKA